ncbi:MAG: hypothetical protein Q4F67_17285 [Propionibacteriaceae bacterium]|nr:hypothetical protein [Propionibacteriaceae bacterium]
MATPMHPHLAQRQERRRSRRRRVAVGLLVMGCLLLALAVFLVLNAGRWGVPMFRFTNEYGSKCRNDWLGHHCSELTMADVERHVRVDLPPEARLESATWRQTHDYELTARLIYPQAVAEEGTARLGEVFGECRGGVPSPLSEVADLENVCVMTNAGGFATGTGLSSEIWRVATGVMPGGDVLVDLHIRSR